MQTGPPRDHPRRTALQVEVKPALTVADAARLANTSTKFIYSEIDRAVSCVPTGRTASTGDDFRRQCIPFVGKVSESGSEARPPTPDRYIWLQGRVHRCALTAIVQLNS